MYCSTVHARSQILVHPQCLVLTVKLEIVTYMRRVWSTLYFFNVHTIAVHLHIVSVFASLDI